MRLSSAVGAERTIDKKKVLSMETWPILKALTVEMDGQQHSKLALFSIKFRLVGYGITLCVFL
jgi:hypothetical protein